MRLIVALPLLVAALLLGDARPATAKCFPMYGNWCGANYPPPGTNPPPADPFDDACRRHDYCYAMVGPSDACDVALVRDLNMLAARFGYLPRPLQWAESMLRMKSGGPMGFPMPTPGDMFGVMDMMGADCGY